MPVNGPPAFPNLSFLTYEMGMIPLCLVWGRMERSLTGKAGPKHRAWHTTNAQESTIPSSGRSPKNNEKGQQAPQGGKQHSGHLHSWWEGEELLGVTGVVQTLQESISIPQPPKEALCPHSSPWPVPYPLLVAGTIHNEAD